MVKRRETKAISDNFIKEPLFDPKVIVNKDNSWPKISIVTASYNQGKFIEAMILSVLNQNYPNLEFIIMDGGSIDETVSILKKYDKYIDHWESKPDRGQTHALNKGYARAAGDVFGWINTDEEYLPGTLLKAGKAFRDQADLDIFFGNRIITDGSRHVVDETLIPAMHPLLFTIYTHGLLLTDTTFWSKKVHRLTGELDEERFRQLYMDDDWFTRLCVNIKKWKHTKDYLSIYKEHDDRKGVTNPPNDEARISRHRVIQSLGISVLQLFLGWVYFGLWRRLQCQGLKGLLWKPRLESIRCMAGLLKK